MNFSSFNFNKNLKIPFNRKDIDEIDDVNAEIIVDNSYSVNTYKGESNEQYCITGNNLVIHTNVCTSIEYVEIIEGKIRAVLCKTPFTICVVLPKEFKKHSNVNIDFKIEDATGNFLSRRCINISVIGTVFVKVKK